jgi:hypothetical protein
MLLRVMAAAAAASTTMAGGQAKRLVAAAGVCSDLIPQMQQIRQRLVTMNPCDEGQRADITAVVREQLAHYRDVVRLAEEAAKRTRKNGMGRVR